VTTAVDSAVLIDLFQQEPKWASRAATALDRAIAAGRVVVCDIVWAEVAGRFASEALLASAMAELTVEFDAIDEAAATRAGRLWRRFRDSGGVRRDRIVPDFPGRRTCAERADPVDRDRGFYRRYSGTAVISPRAAAANRRDVS
jgi:predicted nucleic acid-binding protein